MHIFRWIIGVLAGLMAIGSLLSVVMFLVFDVELWIQRARTFRRSMVSLLLFWFNVEIWGSVLYTIIHWSK